MSNHLILIQGSAKDNSCMFHTCFDINRCNLHHKNIKGKYNKDYKF